MLVAARYARWDGPDKPFSVVATTASRAPGPGEILVAIDLATVCGSDVHTVSGRRPAPVPGVLGHEQVGTVIAAGAGAAVRPGQRIVWSVTASCGHCARCRHHLPQKCTALRKYGHEPLDEQRPLTGGFATHIVLLPGTAVVAVPDGVPDTVASPAGCATATVAAAVAAGGDIRPGSRVLVTGAGMLGLTAVAMLAQRGAYVIAVEPDRVRRERALRFGAAEVSSGPETHADIDLAVELSGVPAAVRAGLDALTVGGRLVLVGSVAPGPAVDLDPERVVRRLLTIVGVHNYRPADLQAAMDFLAAHHRTYPFAGLVEGRYPLEKLDEAFAAARTGSAPRQAVLPQAAPDSRRD